MKFVGSTPIPLSASTFTMATPSCPLSYKYSLFVWFWQVEPQYPSANTTCHRASQYRENDRAPTCIFRR